MASVGTRRCWKEPLGGVVFCRLPYESSYQSRLEAFASPAVDAATWSAGGDISMRIAIIRSGDIPWKRNAEGHRGE
jgi:hypothetical protein